MSTHNNPSGSAMAPLRLVLSARARDLLSKMSPSKRRKISPHTVHITNLPHGIFEDVAKYLAKPSIACFAVAMTTRSSDEKKLVTSSPVCKTILYSTNQSWEVLDFGDIEDDGLAEKLSDEDVHSILMHIDAVNNLKKLKLTGCVNITGGGLNPLRGSVVLKEIDLSLVGQHQSPIIFPEPKISEGVVLPILNSIVGAEGTILEFLRLPKVWRERRSDQLDQFIESFNRLETSRNRQCTQCTVLCREVSQAVDGLNSDQYCTLYGIQNFNCNLCRRFFCYVCETQEENEPNRQCISYCDACEGDYCTDCCLIKNCYMCEKDKCSKCSTMKECQDCEELFCEECSPPYVQKCECGGMNRCNGCATCVACEEPHCDDCFPVKLYCDCWDGEHCKDCADMNQAGSCNCCLEISCNKCIEVVSCEGCKKSNCSRCVDGRDYDVEVCEDCGRGFCFDCRLSECSKDWDGACRKCARKVGINLPQRSLPKFYQYHSAVWEDVKKKNPGAGFGERSAIIVQQYRSLSKDEKSYWDKREKREKKCYKEEIAELEEKFNYLFESPKRPREYDFDSAIQHNSPAFLEAINQHRDDTRRLLELSGGKSLPSDKMQEARKKNLVHMKANNILGILSEGVWMKCIKKAEDEAVTMYTLAPSLKEKKKKEKEKRKKEKEEKEKLEQSLKEKKKKEKENHDVELVMSQAGCSRARAFKSLQDNNWDLVNAIMAFAID